MHKLLLICVTATVLTIANGQEESGECSYYGPGIPAGSYTACGNIFNENTMTAAHKTLPCGTRIQVRNKNNGKTVTVTIDDRGPFVAGRIVDLTTAAFGVVENHDKGVFPCEWKRV